MLLSASVKDTGTTITFIIGIIVAIMSVFAVILFLNNRDELYDWLEYRIDDKIINLKDKEKHHALHLIISTIWKRRFPIFCIFEWITTILFIVFSKNMVDSFVSIIDCSPLRPLRGFYQIATMYFNSDFDIEHDNLYPIDLFKEDAKFYTAAILNSTIINHLSRRTRDRNILGNYKYDTFGQRFLKEMIFTTGHMMFFGIVLSKFNLPTITELFNIIPTLWHSIEQNPFVSIYTLPAIFFIIMLLVTMGANLFFDLFRYIGYWIIGIIVLMIILLAVAGIYSIIPEPANVGANLIIWISIYTIILLALYNIIKIKIDDKIDSLL